MNTYIDPVGILIFVIAVVAAGVILLISRNRKKEKLEKIQALAFTYGWTFTKVDERLRSGFRIQKADWTLESLRTSNDNPETTGSSSVSQSTVWWTKSAVIPEGCVLIGPRQAAVPNLGGIGEMVLQAALQIMIGGDAEYTQGIKEMEISRAALRERFMVWTNQEEAAQRILDMKVENALLKMPKNIFMAVKVTPLCLEIKLRDQDLRNPDYLVSMVNLGEALIEALR